MKKIKFTDTSSRIHEKFYPVPSKMAIPKWIKDLQPYHGGKFQVSGGEFEPVAANWTSKKCIPMLDAVMAGYIIPLPHDLDVSIDNFGKFLIRWPSGAGVDYHSETQVGNHSSSKRGVPKLITPWSIKTPPGYSCLMIPPINTDNPDFTVFSAIVDTDKYFNPMNFPFYLNNDFVGIIPAGTPFVQVIPFKREDWSIDISTGVTPEIYKSKNLIESSFRNAYRNNIWSRKSFN
jgi:hypothetical protein